MGSSELDFGIMCSGLEFDDWQADCIRKLREVDGVNLELLIIDGSNSANTGGLSEVISTILEYGNRTSTGDAINRTAWLLYRQLYDDPPCKSQVDLSDELAPVERISCDVNEDGFSQYFYEDDVREIEEYDLDFALRMGFGIIRGEILEAPKYGVWSYHHDDERRYRGGPPCFWEIYNGDPVTGAILQRLTDRLDGGIVLKRGTFPTQQTYYDNLDNVYYGTTEWPAQVARDVLNGHADYVDRSPTSSNAPIYRSPSPLQILLYELKKWYSRATTVSNGISHWNIGVIEDPIEKSVDGTFGPDVEWYSHPKNDGFLADPFPITIDDTTYIFVEDFSYPEWKGKISYMEYPDGFRNGDLRTAHEEPEHMSYPYLFKHDNAVYATPEIYGSGEVRLYELRSPSTWEFQTTLIDGVDGIDPTVVKYENKWWMFYTKKSYPETKLYVRFTDDLTGEWKPHEKNPVKTDIRSSRPGGTPFIKENGLYRPAQNSVGGYGQKIVINEVKNITPSQYIEEKVSELRPSKNAPYTGMHTLSSRGEITLIDRKKKIRNRHAVRRKAHEIGSRLPL
jgi:hypothetical protein